MLSIFSEALQSVIKKKKKKRRVTVINIEKKCIWSKAT